MRNDPSAPKFMASELHSEAKANSAKEHPEGMVVTNTRPSLVRIAGIKFLPGDTKTIPPEHVARVRAHPWFKTGILVEGQAQMPVPRAVAKPQDLTSYDESKALAFINLETDLRVLTNWAKAETRPAVIDALGKKASSL